MAQKTYSGKTNLRMSPSLHAKAAEQAKREGVSLNHLLVELIALGLGIKLPEK